MSTADLSAKRTTQLNLGDATTGIDVDDFVGKCITFMRRGPSDGNEGSTAGRTRGQDDSDDDADTRDGYDEGDAFNWEWLGRRACFPNNVRPPVPGFLLGPLSVRKRARRATQRRERLQKRDPKDIVRPEELKAQDLEKAENSNLTTLCTNIRELLVYTMKTGPAKVEEEIMNMPGDEIPYVVFRAVMLKHGIADDEGVPLFHFVVNPKSFGQTVENLFYVSFLIRDGTAGFGNDTNMLPTLREYCMTPSSFASGPNAMCEDATIARSAKEIQEENISKHQAVFHLDYETWEDIIETFDIKESIIPHRQSDEVAEVSASGWYG